MPKKFNDDIEQLLTVADSILKPHDRLVMVDEDEPGEANIGFVSLALRFRQRHDLVLRACMENWDRHRIHRELY